MNRLFHSSKKFKAAVMSLSFVACSAYSQSSDLVYYVRIITADTHEAIPFVKLTVSEDDVVNGVWTSDMNGVVKIVNPTFQIGERMSVKVAVVGYLTREFIGPSLTLNDTLEIVMELNYTYYDPLYIWCYWVPIVDKDPNDLSRKERKKLGEKPYIDSSAIYSSEILATYDSIVNGTCFNYQGGNKMPASYFFEHLAAAIRYPDHACKYAIEETIYFRLTFAADDGKLTEIKLMRGVCPVLVIEVAKVLRSISHVLFLGNNQYKPFTWVIPISFVLV